MTATQSPTVPFAELTPAWLQALHTAHEARLTVTEVHRELSGFDLTVECDVASRSRPGETHRVVYVADCAGIHVCCGCERMTYRAVRGDRCIHAAAVLVFLGAIDPQKLPALPVKRLRHLFEDEA